MSSSDRLGVYGFALSGLAGAARLMHRADENWPTLQVERGDLGLARVDVELPLRGEGVLRMQREPLRAGFALPTPVDDAELLHPYLVPAAALAGRWHGRQAFHAGGFVVGDGVWAVVGERETGKSTLLAGLHANGIPVVCDDMLMVSDGVVFPGPRAIDLRAEAARELGLGEPIGLVGARERWRLTLDGEIDALPLRGWVFLEWGERSQLGSLPPAERVSRLLRQRTLQDQGGDPAVLDLVAKPAVVLRRPRHYATVVEDAQLLVHALVQQ